MEVTLTLYQPFFFDWDLAQDDHEEYLCPQGELYPTEVAAIEGLIEEWGEDYLNVTLANFHQVFYLCGDSTETDRHYQREECHIFIRKHTLRIQVDMVFMLDGLIFENK